MFQVIVNVDRVYCGTTSGCHWLPGGDRQISGPPGFAAQL